MKVQVNHEACEGHGKCAAAAPEVFEFRPDEEQSYVRIDEVPEQLKQKVDRAIRACPRQAVSWVAET